MKTSLALVFFYSPIFPPTPRHLNNAVKRSSNNNESDYIAPIFYPQQVNISFPSSLRHCYIIFQDRLNSRQLTIFNRIIKC